VTFGFPEVNATLNATSAVLLAIAFVLIKKGKWRAHGYTMAAALLTSTAFLACYLTYHAIRVRQGIGVTRFPDHAILRPVYLTILLTHTVLAAVIVPLILITVARAYLRQWHRHVRIAPPTLALWMYVSVTGVVVYWMLYHVAPNLK
jgi:protein SCO1/2/putative membrane protein